MPRKEAHLNGRRRVLLGVVDRSTREALPALRRRSGPHLHDLRRGCARNLVRSSGVLSTGVPRLGQLALQCTERMCLFLYLELFSLLFSGFQLIRLYLPTQAAKQARVTSARGCERGRRTNELQLNEKYVYRRSWRERVLCLRQHLLATPARIRSRARRRGWDRAARGATKQACSEIEGIICMRYNSLASNHHLLVCGTICGSESTGIYLSIKLVRCHQKAARGSMFPRPRRPGYN